MSGKFITFEGIDGAGKTSNIRNIINYFEQHPTERVQPVSEYSDVPFCKHIRDALNQQEFPVNPVAEALTFYASRIEHTSRCIKPYLQSGTHVVADRYYHSTLAYQGVRCDEVQSIHDFLIPNLIKPDLVIFLDVSVDTYRERVLCRDGKVDAIEGRGEAYFTQVRDNFLKNDDIIIVDANMPLDDVLQETLNIVKDFLGTHHALC